MQKFKKLVFFFPWSEVSGGPFFLTKLANEIAREGTYEVYYTDYYHGLADTLLEEKSIKLLRYNNEGKDFPIFPEEPVILVTPEYWAHMVPRVHPDTRIIFVNWHNECLPVLKRDWDATDRFLNRFLELVNETSSVFFLDKTHWLAHEREGANSEEVYVPITSPQKEKEAQTELIRDGERNIAVLGRLCLDKIYAVLDLVDNIIALRDKVKTTIYVIGNGDYENLLFKRKLPPHIRLVKCGTMELDDAISLMCRKTDVLFAMGTSVLAGASAHLPSVVIPNDVKSFECNRYAYLYESSGYALGWSPEQIDELGIETHPLEDIFRDLYEQRQKAQIGDRCYSYYIHNHAQNLSLFYEAINRSTLTAGQYREFLRTHINWKRLGWLIRHRINRLRGKVVRQLSILGFPVFTVSATNWYHLNVFVCCIPLLRIKHVNGSASVYILPAVWVYRAFQAAFRRLTGRTEEKE